MTARRLSCSFPVLALAALAAACSSPTDAGKSSIQLSGTLNGNSWPISATNIAPFPAGTGCSGQPTPWHQTGLVMTGTLAGQGNASFQGNHCNVTTTTAGVISAITVDGAGTMTVANGDQAAFTYVLTSFQIVTATPPAVLNATLTLTFTGGTGQFTGRTGTGTLSCVRTTPIDLTTLPAHAPPFANIYACPLSATLNPKT